MSRPRLRSSPQARGTEHDVIMLYRLFLGREPESPQVIAEHLSKPFNQTFWACLASDEFKERVVRPLQAGEDIHRKSAFSDDVKDQLQWLTHQFVLSSTQQQSLARAANWTEFFARFWDFGLSDILHGTLEIDAIGDLLLSYERVCDARLNSGLPSAPNVIGVGAPRSGTTSLYYALRGHPEIYMSRIKELNYFGYRSQAARGPERGIPFDAYRMFFLGHAGQPVVGEISPVYLSTPQAAQEIRNALGDACKIIVQLRNPIDRFVSHFWYAQPKASTAELARFADQALDGWQREALDQALGDAGRALLYSLYAEDIRRYQLLFDPAHLLILDYASFQHPDVVTARLASFLGVAAFAEQPGIENSSRQPVQAALTPATRRRLERFFADDIARTAMLTGINL